ncbi:glycosyltransferase family 1 protein [Chroococcidiopsis sp. CCMEE 29]|uniref:glycosyltransferase family 4 protein n=1 Tax=Chroococcidiopsis sp. CCMEE 29 TaxID=155894 RepID=UPI0020222E74|nr:glycosyltransferase family 1 protein [Chroococcidiopsis sp. CCMEE 29]
MHILISALSRFSKPTGLCRHAANLAQCLAISNKASKITLVVGAWQKYYFQTSFKLDLDKITLVSVDIKNNSLSRNVWFAYSLPRLANSLDSDIVHLSFPIPFFRSLFSSPIIVTVHDLYPYDFPANFGFPNALFNRLFLKQCINNSDGIICVSHCTLERLKSHFVNITLRKQTDVIYNYIDFSYTPPKIPKVNNITEFPFLLSVAQHRKNKNLDLLIKSYSYLINKDKIQKQTKLIIVGSSGGETENIRSLISRLSVQEHVLLLSSIDDGELCWLYQNCDLFISPSSTEGFCLPLAEALYFSCKVVCSNIPIFREIGASKCTYFNLQDEPLKNLSQAIVNCLQQPHPNSTPDIITLFSKASSSSQHLEFYSKFI